MQTNLKNIQKYKKENENIHKCKNTNTKTSKIT